MQTAQMQQSIFGHFTILFLIDLNILTSYNICIKYIRRYNDMHSTVQTLNAPQAIGPYSQAIICNNMVYVSGQIPINPATGLLEGDNIATQTEQVMKNLAAVLTAAGTSFEHVVKTTCYLKNMKDFQGFNEVYGKYAVSLPARACFAVVDLPKNSLIEVECIAEVKE